MLQNGIRADSRDFAGTYGRKCGGMSTGTWGRRCHRHVHGRVAGQVCRKDWCWSVRTVYVLENSQM